MGLLPASGLRGAVSALRVRAIAASALLALAAVPATAQTAAPAPEAAAAPDAATSNNGKLAMRDRRYCEVLPLSFSLTGPTASVYNTVGHDDCPEDLWEKLTSADVRNRFDVYMVVMNGPRYFIMDSILGSGASMNGEVVDIGGITFEKRAEVALSWTDIIRDAPYTETTVDRDTVYRFDAGKPVFELTAPDGAVYVMQSYARIVDKTLSFADLPKLGSRLKLPKGWTYAERVPQTDLMASATGKATVIQDDLKNTYQKLAPATP